MFPGLPRVVSLLPSATETLCAIGGQHLLVGRSHECDYPAGLEALPVLTAARTFYNPSSERAACDIDRQVREQFLDGHSLYTLDEELLARLEPDVVLTQDLCAVCSIDLNSVRRVAERMEAATGRRPSIVSFNPSTVEDILDDLLVAGGAVGMVEAARATMTGLRDRLYRAADYVTNFTDGPNVAFLEWTDPLFVGGHWTPQLIERAGGRHPLNPSVPKATAGAAAGPVGVTLRAAGRSVAVPPEVLVATRPDVLIICPCGLNLAQARAETQRLSRQEWWNELPAVKHGRVALVDGNQMFNRPGPRLVDAFEWLVGYLNERPEVMPKGFPWLGW